MNTATLVLTSLTLAAASQTVSASTPARDAGLVSISSEVLGAFSQGRLDSWDTQRFNGETEYNFVEQHGRQVLHAVCTDSASGLVKKQKIDLSLTPILNWSWRVEDIYEGIDETKREGDDYPASLYVAIKTGFTMLSVRALHYVWSSGQPQDSHWDSAFTSNVKQIAVRSGLDSESGQWYAEARNVKEDFKRYFDLDIDHLDSVSLMTDCDNSDGHGEAYYGDIMFSPEADALLTLEQSQLH